MNIAPRFAVLLSVGLSISCGSPKDDASDPLTPGEVIPTPGETSVHVWDVPDSLIVQTIAYDRDDRNRVYVHVQDPVTFSGQRLYVGSISDKELVPYCGEGRSLQPVTPAPHEAAYQMQEDGTLVAFMYNERLTCTKGAGGTDLGGVTEVETLSGSLDVTDFKQVITTDEGFFYGLTYYRYKGAAAETYGDPGTAAYMDHDERRILFTSKSGTDLIVHQLDVDTLAVSDLHTLTFSDNASDFVTYIDEQGLIVFGDTIRAYRFADGATISDGNISSSPAFFDFNGNLVSGDKVFVFGQSAPVAENPISYGTVHNYYYTRSGWKYQWGSILNGDKSEFVAYVTPSIDQVEWENTEDLADLNWKMLETDDGYCVFYSSPFDNRGAIAIMPCGTFDYTLVMANGGMPQKLEGFRYVDSTPLRTAFPFVVISSEDRNAEKEDHRYSGFTFVDGKLKPLFHLAEQYYPRPYDDADFAVVRNQKIYIADGFTRP